MRIVTVVLHRIESRTGGHTGHTINTYMAWVTDRFKSLVDEGKYHLGNHFRKESAWYVYSIFLQQELDTVKEEWNSHYMTTFLGFQMDCFQLHNCTAT